MRTISIAYKDLKPNENYETMTNEELEVNMTLIGISGIKDHLRKGVKEAVSKCKTAGITVRMVSFNFIFFQLFFKMIIKKGHRR